MRKQCAKSIHIRLVKYFLLPYANLYLFAKYSEQAYTVWLRVQLLVGAAQNGKNNRRKSNYLAPVQ